MTLATVQSSDARSYRLTNIDMMRGLVIVIMTLDHVRDYFMLSATLDPLGQPDVGLGLYLTRWVTHFCAPVFVFLAGTSAGLMAVRKSKSALGSFLVKRGLWLIFVEIFIISTAITFAPFGLPQLNGNSLILLQVIWAIGGSMVVLGGLQYFGPRFCLIVGLVILGSHNLLDGFWPVGSLMGGSDPRWYGLFSQSSSVMGPFQMVWAYPIVPWIGMMAFGFGTASLFTQDDATQKAQLLRWGSLFIIAFLILRALDVYGDANGWKVQEIGLQATILDFMNVTKYPPSILFTFATLGPMAIICAYAGQWSGWIKDTLVMFGRVPFFFYIAHIYLIHSASVLYGMLQGFETKQMLTVFFFYPKGFGTDLAGVYLVWIILLMILYPACKWMAGVKARRKDWWLSYL